MHSNGESRFARFFRKTAIFVEPIKIVLRGTTVDVFFFLFGVCIKVNFNVDTEERVEAGFNVDGCDFEAVLGLLAG